jgi:DNA-binding GntR family transcriptional regulator
MSKTAIDKTYHRIRDGIFNRIYPPGFHLKEEEISAALEISRTPVRQAIRLLVDEGLVVIADNGRSYVADITNEDIEVIYDLVSMLESYSAGLAAKNISKAKISELREIQDKLEHIDPNDDRAFLEANYRFHKTIHDAGGSRLLKRIIQNVLLLSTICYLKKGVHTEHETAIRQHQDIIDALEKGDAEYAKLKMKVHIETVRQQYREILSS